MGEQNGANGLPTPAGFPLGAVPHPHDENRPHPPKPGQCEDMRVRGKALLLGSFSRSHSGMRLRF